MEFNQNEGSEISNFVYGSYGFFHRNFLSLVYFFGRFLQYYYFLLSVDILITFLISSSFLRLFSFPYFDKGVKNERQRVSETFLLNKDGF